MRMPTLSDSSRSGNIEEDSDATRLAHINDPETRLKTRGLLDLAARISNGIYIYLALWLIIAGVTGLLRDLPLFSWACAAWLALVAVFRHLLARRIAGLATKRLVFAYATLRASVLANGISWGLLTASSIIWPKLEPIRIALIIVALGLCSAGSMAMAIDSFLRYWFPVVVIIPVSIAAASQPNDGNLLLACLIAIYTIYIMTTTGIVHRDYWRAARATAALEHASQTDALTQVSNRMSFDQEYQREWRRARRSNEGLGILMIDLDHFKSINDTYGHPAGDAVLKNTAAAIRKTLLRAGDSVARYGGEEFVVLLPHTNLEGTQAVAKRILSNVASQRILIDPGTELNITCSIGSAWAHPENPAPSEELLKQADTALYRAKAGGRNQVCHANVPGNSA